MGTVGDILASEGNLSGLLKAAKFAAMPVVASDMTTGFKTLQRLAEDIPDFGIGGAILRTPKNLAPIMGSGPRRVLKRFETPHQREGYINSRKRRVKGQILDSIIAGDHQQAGRLIAQWNKTYGYESPILYDDVGPDQIAQRVALKYEKLIPPQYFGKQPGFEVPWST